MSQKVYKPVFANPTDRPDVFADFVAIVRQLRRECPWDREQTHESVTHLLIEEAYEAVDAIESGCHGDLMQELGDLLLHVVFHSVMAEENGKFGIADVMEAEIKKLVRRHPHVFGDVAAGSVAEVLANWEEIKRTEGERHSALEGVPRALPALLCAYRMQEKAAAIGFDFATPDDAMAKVGEEIGEFRDAGSEDEFGDVLFALVNYARQVGINAENALRRANDKFKQRFQHVERRLAAEARPHQTLEEMDLYWEEAKRMERTSEDP